MTARVCPQFLVLFVELGTEGIFVEAHYRGLAGMIVNGNDIEAERAFAHVALGEEALRGANHDALLLACNAEFR